MIPDNSAKPYALLRKVLKKTGLAAIGKVTMSTKERVVLIHYYQNAIVATTLRYPDEVTNPSHFAELKDLPEAGEEGLALMTMIVDKMTKDLDLRVSHGGYKERIEALISEGRVLIDTAKSFVYTEGGLKGVLMASRLSGLSPNLTSRFTPGTLISSYEVFEALRLGVAVPFRKRDAESVRDISELKASDRGGMIFQPEPGVYENVHQIDFTSLYPSIIVKYNLSPETIEHPELKGFLSTVLSSLLGLRIETKRRKKTDKDYAGIDSVLKWMLVTCFG